MRPAALLAALLATGGCLPFPKAPPGVGPPSSPSLLDESDSPDGDFPDCIVGCAAIAGEPALDLGGDEDGFAGRLDVGDVDVLAVVAPRRTVLTIAVRPAEGSLMDPLIRTVGLVAEMTFADNEAADLLGARTVVAVPQDGVPVFIEVRERTNVPTDIGAGGVDFTYEATVETSAFAPVELTPSVPWSGVIARPGDLTYFRFYAAKPSSTPLKVTITNTGGPEFTLFGVGMDTGDGTVEWTSAPLVAEAGVLQLDRQDFRPCGTFSPCGDGDGDGEYIFAVSDLNGLGGDDFTFDVTVSAP